MTSPFYFYTIDGESTSCQQPKKQRHHPTTSHLALRFPRDSSTLEQAQLKRDDLLLQRQIKLAQRFTKIQRTLQQVKARREQQALEFLQSLKNAEQNRSDHLEQVRTTNKQLVERAKSIAHQHRSQTKADRERRRLDLEKRLEASERRRLNYLGLSKSTMASRMNSSDDDDRLATTTAKSSSNKQKEYYSHHHHHRRHSLASLLHSFHHLGLPVISQQDTWLGFQSLGRLLRQQNVITTTDKILTLALDHPSSTSPNNRSRMFLSTYMLVLCPHDILQSPESPEDKSLLEAAQDLLQKFETWVDHPSRRPLKMSFISAWKRYQPLFDQWKSKDRDQLVSSMMAYYLELASVQQTLVPHHSTADEGDDVQYLLTQQMEQLKYRIGKMGGEDAVDALMTQVTAMTITATNQQQNVHDDQQNIEDIAGLDNHIYNKEQADQFHSVLSQLPGAPPLLTNAQLAHELILDPEFQLQAHRPDDHHDSLEERVRAMTLRAYFESTSEDIQNGDYKSSVLPLLEDIKKKLLDMVKEGNQAHEMINDVLDVDLMRQQIEHGTFDLCATIETVVQCQRRLCAPCRDVTLDEIQAQPHEPGWQLEQIMGLLDDMALDLANFRLRSLRPYLAPMAVEYEQQQFRQTHPTMNLPHTSAWLSNALQKWHQIAAQRNPDNVQPVINNHLSSPHELFHEAFLGLVINNEVHHNLPETLEMDHQRLVTYQITCQRLISVASLLMVAKNVGKVTSTTSLTTLTSTLLTLMTHSPSSQHISAELLRLTPVDASESMTSLMVSMVQRILSHTDTVYALLGRRVLSILKSQLLHHQFVSDAVLASSSLEYIKAPLQQLANQLDTFCHHHLKVHLQWYTQYLQQQQQQ